MGPLARFLIALERLARRQGLKIEDAFKFAKMVIPYAKTKKEKLRKIIKHYETSL